MTPKDRLVELDGVLRMALDREDFEAALTTCREVEQIAREEGDEGELIFALFHGAWVLRYAFRGAAEARPMLEEAHRLALAASSERLLWPALINLADLALDEKDWSTAASLAAEALSPSWDFEPPPGDQAFVVEIAAFAAAGVGDSNDALRLYNAAVAGRGDGWDPTSMRVIRERYERLMAPARTVQHGTGDRLTLDQAIELARTRRHLAEPGDGRLPR